MIGIGGSILLFRVFRLNDTQLRDDTSDQGAGGDVERGVPHTNAIGGDLLTENAVIDSTKELREGSSDDVDDAKETYLVNS